LAQIVFRLGLRSLHATLQLLEGVSGVCAAKIEKLEDTEMRQRIAVIVDTLLAIVTRLVCDMALLSMSRAVGAADIEEAYEDALIKIGDTCATQLMELAVKLDHSEDFPFKLLKSVRKRTVSESKLASQVLSDLVVRHTTIFPLQRETLKRIALALKLDTPMLLEAAGHK
jgi:hypothetical protein